MKFAIRDDDTSYFTKPEELERAYDFVERGAISLSVVPSTVYSHKDTVFPYGEAKQCGGYFDISENTELVEYLREGYKNGRYDILLHGFSHEYKQVDGEWISEMLWKDQERLDSELAEGKARLETLFDCSISVFVAPNNHMGKRGIAAIEKLGMDFSGIIGFFDRRLSLRYVLNFISRWGYRFFKKIQSPLVYNYGRHKEMCAHGAGSLTRLKRIYHECKKHDVPFVVYTHYWSLNAKPEQKELLREIYKYVINDGAELVPLSDCFR